MKKLLMIILAASLALSIAACSNKTEETVAPAEEAVISDNAEETPSPAPEETPDATAAPEETKKPDKTPTSTATPPAPSATPSAPPATPPAPVETPSPTPPAPATMGNTLLAAFKSKAAAGGSALAIAEELIANPVIEFKGSAMSVEPGYLTGFDNTEITGFKEGAMFAPMIGTIPFVGYVFTLDDAASTSAFISSLRSAANLRWNICTSADEMITGSVGNKVFFVMCPSN